MDEAYWPAFSTVRPRSHKAHWEYIGEGFVKELDFGRVWLRLNEADEGDKDDIVAEWKGDAKPFLERTMVSPLWCGYYRTYFGHSDSIQDGPTSFELLHSSDEDKKSIVKLEARYLPVPVQLEPRESVNSTWSRHVFNILLIPVQTKECSASTSLTPRISLPWTE